MKQTYRHWINPECKPNTGRYYEFKTFKVYWAYRWYIARQRDLNGMLDPSDRTRTKKIFGNDACMFD